MAAQASPIAGKQAQRAPRTMRVDPSRHVVPDDVPQSMLDNWQAMLDAAAAERKALQDNFDTRLLAFRAYSANLRSIISDAYFMHHDIVALAYLFDKALIDDAQEDSDLLKASHLVVDVMQTIAARLAALDERAAAVDSGADL